MNYIQKAARYLELQRDLASAINDTKTERKCDAALIELKIDPDLSAAAASKLKVGDKVPLRIVLMILSDLPDEEIESFLAIFAQPLKKVKFAASRTGSLRCGAA